jgi:hypothetical protein
MKRLRRRYGRALTRAGNVSKGRACSKLRRRYGRSHVGARFFMDFVKSSDGRRGWQLAEWIEGRGPTFRFWSPSSLEVRQHAHRLGATPDNLLIEGQPARTWKMPEGFLSTAVRGSGT